MALDKMVDSTKLDNALTATADAIREKGGGAIGSGSGAIVTVTDALAASVIDMTVGINPAQSGSGDPSPENVRPISGYSSANITRTGKNIWGGLTMAQSFSSGVTGYSIDTEAKTFTFQRATSSPYSVPLFTGPFKPNTQYTLLAQYSNASVNTSIRVRYSDDTYVNVDFANTSNIKTTRAFTTAQNRTVKEIYLAYVQTGKTTIYYEESGVFEGVLTYNDFEPYNGTTYAVSFGSAGTVYGGTLDMVNGTLTVTHRYMLADGVNVKTTGGYGAAGSKWLPCIVLSTADKVDSSTPIVATSYLKTSGVNVQNDENSAAHGNSGAVIALHIGTMQGTDGTYGYNSTSEVQAAVNAYLQTNPLQICYKLATPQTYQLTPTEVTLLAGTNNVWSDTGNITLKYPIDSELIPFDLENETGFADAINSISSGIEVDDIIIIGDYGLCLNNFTMSNNTCISEVGTVSGNTLIAV